MSVAVSDDSVSDEATSLSDVIRSHTRLRALEALRDALYKYTTTTTTTTTTTLKSCVEVLKYAII